MQRLDDFEWPESVSIEQPSRRWSPEDGVAVAQAAHRIPLTPERFLSGTSNLPTAARIQWLLSHGNVNFNGVTPVRQEREWSTRLAGLIEASEPIPIVYPLFCPVANPAKQQTRPGITAGELCTIHWFVYLDEMARIAYPPGLRIHILIDATLYNNALQNTLAFANLYIWQFRTAVIEARAAHCVEVHDYAALLAPYAHEFDTLYNGFYPRLVRGENSLLSSDERFRLLRSVRANVNMERFALSYTDQKALFGPSPDLRHPLAAEVENLAQAALLEQVAVRLACAELDLPGRLWPRHIRASCHKGLKSGLAVVGLRVYPEYYRHSRFLPNHGKPLLRADGRLVVQPEFMLRSRPELTRIQNEHGDSFLYREGR